MSRQYIADSQAIINLQGLRLAIRADKAFSSGDNKYSLTLFYKGLTQQMDYEFRSDRDQTFDEIAEKLTKPKAKSSEPQA